MNKKVLYILPLLVIFTLCFTGCGKKDNSGKSSKKSFTGSEITVHTKDDCYIINQENFVSTNLVNQSLTIKILSYNDSDETFTFKITSNKDNTVFSSYFSRFYYDYDALLLILEDFEKSPKTLESIFLNQKNTLEVSQATEVLSKFLSYLPESYYSYDPKSEYQENFYYYTRSIEDLIYNTCDLTDGIDITTPFHLMAEKFGYALSSYFFTYYSQLINIQDENGKTPLMRAIEAENYEACKVLYKNQPSIALKDKSGKNFFDYSKECKNENIKNLFSIYAFDLDSLKLSILQVLSELAFSESFKLIGLNTFDVPYTIYERAASKNIQIKASSKDDFITELAVQELQLSSSDSGSDNTGKNTEPKSDGNYQISAPKNTAFVFDSYDDGTPDVDTRLKLREKPSADSKEKGVLTYGTKVTILEKSEKTDVIGNITDFWYKVNADGITGWCFGGFLAVPVVKDRHSDDFKNFTQVDFKKGSMSKVVLDCKITGLDNKTYDVKAMEEVEILETYKNDRGENQFVSYGDFYYGGPKQSYTKYPYYLVRNSKNEIGIISGANLSHEQIYEQDISDSDATWFISYKKNRNGYVSYYADIYEYNIQTKKARKYQAVKPDDNAFALTDFCLGYELKESEGYPLVSVSYYIPFNHKQEIYFGEDAGKKVNLKLHTLCISTNCYDESSDGDGTNYFVYTITDDYAVESHRDYTCSWSSNNSSSFSVGYFMLYQEDDGIKIKKFNSYRYSDYDGTVEGTDYEYYKWNDYVFDKTGEKHEDFLNVK